MTEQDRTRLDDNVYICNALRGLQLQIRQQNKTRPSSSNLLKSLPSFASWNKTESARIMSSMQFLLGSQRKCCVAFRGEGESPKMERDHGSGQEADGKWDDADRWLVLSLHRDIKRIGKKEGKRENWIPFTILTNFLISAWTKFRDWQVKLSVNNF